MRKWGGEAEKVKGRSKTRRRERKTKGEIVRGENKKKNKRKRKKLSAPRRDTVTSDSYPPRSFSMPVYTSRPCKVMRNMPIIDLSSNIENTKL